MVKRNEPIMSEQAAFQMGETIELPDMPVQENVLSKQQEEKPQAKEKEEATIPKDPIKALEFIANDLVVNYPHAPSFQQLLQWKQMHKNLFFLPLDDKVVIYRYIKRQEWLQMQADEGVQKLNRAQIEDYIFEKCVLWPKFSVIEKAGLEAGFISTVHDQIQMHSMFLDPNALAQITIKL